MIHTLLSDTKITLQNAIFGAKIAVYNCNIAFFFVVGSGLWVSLVREKRRVSGNEVEGEDTLFPLPNFHSMDSSAVEGPCKQIINK
jgi:hypothetical protein